MNAYIDISEVTLETERLILRPWRASDLEDLFEYASVDGVGQMAGWLPHRDIEESRIILGKFIEHKKTFALEFCGKVIGSLGIEEYRRSSYPQFEDLRCRALGYVLSRDYWGHGLMPEAVKAVLAYLFDSVNLDAVFCSHYLWNGQSKRVIEKSGFSHLGYSVHETASGGEQKTEDHIIRREDWFAGSGRAVRAGESRYAVRELLGRGKGGYSWLVERDGELFVLKQIHHEPCDYYSFGDKMAAELRDYERLMAAGIRIPKLISADGRRERIVKEYIEGETASSLMERGESAEPYIGQLRDMAELARAAGLNIDYYPANFVIRDGLLWYVDYECNEYSEEWDLEHWGMGFWK